MAIRDSILTLKNKEGTLTGNKVCNFAYDDTAFNDDTTAGANGVSVYNYANHNNIPVKDASILKVNDTIITKGFRSQVSTLPRMLLNHIFGRVSYNLNKTVDTLYSLLSDLYSAVGQPNGLATLDNTGRIPYSQLPLSAVEYKGAWNASTNTPALASGTGTFGDEYIVSVEGTQNIGEGSVTYNVGDRVIYNGSIWQRIPSSSVRTVNNKNPDVNGNVTINASDIVTPDVYGLDRSNVGKSWETKGASVMSNIGRNGILYGTGKFIATAGGREIYDSVDGENWVEKAYLRNYTYSLFERSKGAGLYYANGMWLLSIGQNYSAGGLNYGDNVFWSTDGTTWRPCTGLPKKVSVKVILFADGVWLIGCDNDYTSEVEDRGLFYSTDGKSWSLVNWYNKVYSIYHGNGLWLIACGEISTSCGLRYATDPTSLFTPPSDAENLKDYEWNLVYGVESRWGSTTFIAGKFFACAVNHGLWYSDSGMGDWTQAYALRDCTIKAMLFADNKIVVCTEYYGLFWSYDGVSWNRTSTTAIRTYTFNCIDYADGRWIAGSDGHGTWWSEDGNHWYQSEDNNTSTINCLYNNKGTWFAGFNGNGILRSAGALTNNVKAILDWLIYAVDNLIS